jgi:hypothetical protein
LMADQHAQRNRDEHLDIQGSQQFSDCHCYYLGTFLGAKRTRRRRLQPARWVGQVTGLLSGSAKEGQDFAQQ